MIYFPIWRTGDSIEDGGKIKIKNNSSSHTARLPIKLPFEWPLFSSSKFNYPYHFTNKQFAKWCEGKQVRPHGGKVAVPLHMGPFECAQALMRVQHRRRLAVMCTSSLSWHLAAANTVQVAARTHTPTHTHLKYKHGKDNEHNWRGYYRVSSAFYNPLFFLFSDLLFFFLPFLWKNIMRPSSPMHQRSQTSSS